jgi:trk system potassium uptake protein TrkH
MDLRMRLVRHFSKKQKRRLSPTQTIALVFAALILLGACLLSLPAASRSGESCGFLKALFTATSATCVTGLVMFDTWTQWSGFGQIVILCLIEIGGLGFMTAASLFVFVLRRRIGMKQRMLMAQALSVNDMEMVVRLQKWVLYGSLSVQLIGAVLLMLRFLPGYGFTTAAKWGVFHSVSAFCNAGFDIFGVIDPSASLITFNNDPYVLLVISGLIIVSGLGFFVWEEVVRVRKWSRFSVYTKLVLLTTLTLLIGGMTVFCLLEWNNPATLGSMSVPQKLLNGFFQSVTCRTAGFVSVDQAALTDSGKAMSMVLMMIGGSSGSTAGGIKTVTAVVLMLFLLTRLRGRQTVRVFRHTVPDEQIMNAMTIVSIVMCLALFGGIVISATSPVSFVDALYESISALATVGTTAGATGNLSLVSQILIIIYMYFGRVGVLTLSLGFLMGNRAEDRYRYAHTNLLIG